MRFLFTTLLVLVLGQGLEAGPLTQAKVTKIINHVEVVSPEKGAHPAAISEVIKDQIGLRTGSKSRSELMFEDQTLTRIGPDTYFSFKAGTRDMTLGQGTMLLQVPKGIGGAKIRTAAVTAAITGTTIMMEYVPGKDLKVLVLEGSLRLSRNGVFGDSLLLTPGKMVIMPPNAKRIPDPVSVDLAHVLKTSTLVNMKGKNGAKDAKPLPSIGLINQEVDRQSQEKTQHGLVDTNLVILGKGTDVVLGSDAVIATLDSRTNAGDDAVLAFNSETPTPFPTATPAPTATIPPNETPTPTPAPSSTPTPTPSPSATTTPSPSPTATPSATPTPSSTPSATPTATPIGGVTPLPTPDASATPAPSPVSTVDTPPVLNGAIVFDKKKMIDTKKPRIMGGGGNFDGSFYKGPVLDGPASWFAFGNSSSYDAQRDFDGRFGVNYDQPFPTKGVAIFRFASINFTDAPKFKVKDGPIDIALIGDTGISATGHSFSLDLKMLGSLTLATNSGPIAISNIDFKASGSTFQFLQLYQRGNSAFSYGGDVSAPSASFYIDSGGSLTLASGGDVDINLGEFNATGALILSGTLDANFLQLTSLDSIQINSGVASPDYLFAFAPTLSTTKSLNVLGGELSIGAGGIFATGHDLTGFDNIVTTGDLYASNISVHGLFSVGGDFIASTSPFSISAFTIELPNGLNRNGGVAAPGGTVTLNAAGILIDSGAGAINGISLNGGGNLLGDGGDGGTLNLGTTGTPITNDVTINAPITATAGSSLIFNNSTGGTVNATANGTIAVNSTVKVSDNSSTSAAHAGHINLTSNKTTGTAISVSSSGQLLALLNSLAPGPGGSIKLVSAGGAINMNGTATADRGTVEMTNNGANGVVNLTNATLHGDTVKAGALGNNGTLNVGGGSIDAANTIKLYAGGSNGQVNFTDNVTLSGTSLKVIAADAVTVFNGKTVTVLGSTPASVFANTPNYTGSGGNGSTTGTFGGQGATTQPLSSAPGY